MTPVIVAPSILAADFRRLGERYLTDQRAQGRAWADLAHVLFNVKEFIYIN